MALAGRLHPLLIHFPIVLVIVAVGAECLGAITGDDRWRFVNAVTLRAGAASAAVAAIAGWLLASAPEIGRTPLLEWHRWFGTAAAALALLAAVAARPAGTRTAGAVRRYRVLLLAAGALVPVAAHLGATMVWGADFLRP